MHQRNNESVFGPKTNQIRGNNNVVPRSRSRAKCAHSALACRGAHYDYAPFGAVSAGTPSGSAVPANPLQWSSEIYDSELDLVYYNYRHYSPSLGRFLSRDPIEEQGGLNLYAFVKNNAIRMIDLSGRNFFPETYLEFYFNFSFPLKIDPCENCEANPGTMGVDKILNNMLQDYCKTIVPADDFNFESAHGRLPENQQVPTPSPSAKCSQTPVVEASILAFGRVGLTLSSLDDYSEVHIGGGNFELLLPVAPDDYHNYRHRMANIIIISVGFRVSF